MIKAGIIGGAGYTAGELIRLLLNHPETEIVFINSSSNAGNRITDVHEGLYGETDLRFTDQLPLDEIDVLFFCTAHGDTKKFMESHNVPEDLHLPCHRVVNSQGRLVPGWTEQRALLENEGVRFRANGFVDMKKSQWEFMKEQ